MSLFPSFNYPDHSSSFTPLFRLLDDYDNYNSGGNGSSARQQSSRIKTFNPKFDVKEVTDAYELHGELPGIEQKNVEIEFSDIQTITIKGRSERSYTSGTPSAGSIESPAANGAITEGGETNHESHKATVEDEDAVATKGKSTTTVAKADDRPQEPEPKFWVSERSIGEFSRSFTFPVRVDQDAVRASMENGILSIVVPKAKKHGSRKITIS